MRHKSTPIKVWNLKVNSWLRILRHSHPTHPGRPSQCRPGNSTAVPPRHCRCTCRCFGIQAAVGIITIPPRGRLSRNRLSPSSARTAPRPWRCGRLRLLFAPSSLLFLSMRRQRTAINRINNSGMSNSAALFTHLVPRPHSPQMNKPSRKKKAICCRSKLTVPDASDQEGSICLPDTLSANCLPLFGFSVPSHGPLCEEAVWKICQIAWKEKWASLEIRILKLFSETALSTLRGDRKGEKLDRINKLTSKNQHDRNMAFKVFGTLPFFFSTDWKKTRFLKQVYEPAEKTSCRSFVSTARTQSSQLVILSDTHPWTPLNANPAVQEIKAFSGLNQT